MSQVSVFLLLLTLCYISTAFIPKFLTAVILRNVRSFMSLQCEVFPLYPLLYIYWYLYHKYSKNYLFLLSCNTDSTSCFMHGTWK